MTNEMTPTYEKMIELGQLPPEDWKGVLVKERRRADRAEAKLKEVVNKLKKLTADWHMDAPLEEIEKLAEELSPDIHLGLLPTRQRDAK